MMLRNDSKLNPNSCQYLALHRHSDQTTIKSCLRWCCSFLFVPISTQENIPIFYLSCFPCQVSSLLNLANRPTWRGRLHFTFAGLLILHLPILYLVDNHSVVWLVGFGLMVKYFDPMVLFIRFCGFGRMNLSPFNQLMS